MRTVSGACALALSALPGGDPVALVFDVCPGAEVAKRFETAVELRVVEVRCGAYDATPLWVDLPLVRADVELNVTDEVLGAGGGRPLELVRAYDRVDTDRELGWRAGTCLAADELEDLYVRFAWDPEHEEYERTWDGWRGDDVLLERLFEDLDYRALLPEEPVRVGERWYVPWSRMAPVLVPGGRVPYVAEEDWSVWSLHFVDAGLDEAFGDWFARYDVECRLADVFWWGDERCATIAIDVEHRGDLELAFAWGELVVFEHLDAHLDLDGCGTLVWNLDAGRFEEFELEIRLRADVVVVSDWRVLLEGEARWTGSVEH